VEHVFSKRRRRTGVRGGVSRGEREEGGKATPTHYDFVMQQPIAHHRNDPTAFQTPAVGSSPPPPAPPSTHLHVHLSSYASSSCARQSERWARVGVCDVEVFFLRAPKRTLGTCWRL